MLKEISGPYYIVCGYTDLRRGIDGLAGIVQQNFKLDVCSGAVFLFCGRRYDRIKALLWEGDGFLLLYKRLDNGRFQWLIIIQRNIKILSTYIHIFFYINHQLFVESRSNVASHEVELTPILVFRAY